MKNIGAKNTLLALDDPNIINVMNNEQCDLNNIIYKELIQSQNQEYKRNKLISILQESLSSFLISQYNNYLSIKHTKRNNNNNNRNKLNNNNNNDITKEFKELGQMQYKFIL